MSRAISAVQNPSRMPHARDVKRDFQATRAKIGSFIAQGREREKASQTALFISFTNVPAFAKLESLVAKSLQLRGYSPVFVTSSEFANARPYFELFGFKRFIFWDELVNRYPARQEYEEKARALLPALSPAAIKDALYRGVPVGRHALSRAMRDKVQGRLELANLKHAQLIYSELAKAIRNTDISNDLMDELNPSVTFVRELGYTPYAQPFAVGLVRGIPGVNWHPGQRAGSWVFKRHTSLENPKIFLSIDDTTWEQIRDRPLTADQEEQLRREFDGRYRPDSKHDTRCLQEGKQLKTREAVQRQLGLDPAKKTAVIFSHLNWDAAFFYGKDLFQDFEEWLIQSVRAACTNDKVNWIIKLHPANVLKLKQRSGGDQLDEVVALGKLGELPAHVQVLRPETDINSWSLYSVADYGLTVRGTVGFELPCLGINVLTAGTGGYSGFGFTVDSESTHEYLERVRTIHTIPKLTEEQVALAKKHAYYLWLERQTSFEDVARVSHLRTLQATHPLQTNLNIEVSSLDEIEASRSLSAFARWIQCSSSPDLLASLNC
jgi:hypothetical protein